jgi:hypothetical protein
MANVLLSAYGYFGVKIKHENAKYIFSQQSIMYDLLMYRGPISNGFYSFRIITEVSHWMF